MLGGAPGWIMSAGVLAPLSAHRGGAGGWGRVRGAAGGDADNGNIFATAVSDQRARPAGITLMV